MPSATTAANAAVVRRYWEEAVNRRRLELVDELFAPGFGSAPGRPPGPEGKRRTMAAFLEAFPDIRFTVERLVADGEWVAVALTATATHRGPFRGIAPTGRRMTGPGMEFFRVVDGRIAEQRSVWDWLGLLQQLGATLTPPAPAAE